MKLQTHCQLKNTVKIKGIKLAVAGYSQTPTSGSSLVDLQIIDKSLLKDKVVCKDKVGVYHQVPVKSIYNPLTDL
jgi:hypothetical protein